MGGLDTPTSGEVSVDGCCLSAMRDDEMTIFRRRKIGFVSQFSISSPRSRPENVALPLLLDGLRRRDIQPRVEEMLGLVSLGGRRRHKPDQLSGGEMQRVAIARAP